MPRSKLKLKQAQKRRSLQLNHKSPSEMLHESFVKSGPNPYIRSYQQTSRCRVNPLSRADLKCVQPSVLSQWHRKMAAAATVRAGHISGPTVDGFCLIGNVRQHSA